MSTPQSTKQTGWGVWLWKRIKHSVNVIFSENPERCQPPLRLSPMLEELSDVSDTFLRHVENLVLEYIKLPIIKLTQTSQGNVGVGASDS